MNMIWLNLGSLLLGLVAWLLPLINLVIGNKAKNKNWAVLSVASVSACAVSLCMQLFEQGSMVQAKDWSALMDTANAVVNVSLVLLVVTITLNVITLVVYRKNSVK
ncbi:hypothetical protein [Candidatus Bathycorpusculum sp.]|uniref:hypothetical protein n=1 Tax=Candidatus Bathycorpusculum sp. TaxID=2994959 RepID=UPI0031CC464C